MTVTMKLQCVCCGHTYSIFARPGMPAPACPRCLGPTTVVGAGVK